MAKTNYTKVEEALAEGMRKIEVNRLLDVADENAAANSKSKGPAKVKVDAIHLQRLATINHDLKLLQKLGTNPYATLKIDKEELQNFTKDPTALTQQDWEKVKIIKEQIAAFKTELDKKTPQNSDDDLVTQQRKKQITKRFNINEKWIPLR